MRAPAPASSRLRRRSARGRHPHSEPCDQACEFLGSSAKVNRPNHHVGTARDPPDVASQWLRQPRPGDHSQRIRRLRRRTGLGHTAETRCHNLPHEPARQCRDTGRGTSRSWLGVYSIPPWRHRRVGFARRRHVCCHIHYLHHPRASRLRTDHTVATRHHRGSPCGRHAHVLHGRASRATAIRVGVPPSLGTQRDAMDNCVDGRGVYEPRR
jgi:hypothetical protein